MNQNYHQNFYNHPTLNIPGIKWEIHNRILQWDIQPKSAGKYIEFESRVLQKEIKGIKKIKSKGDQMAYPGNEWKRFAKS